MAAKSNSYKLSVQEQLTRLKGRNFKPTSQILLHKDISGCTSSCCTAAYASFRSAIVAHSQYTEDGFHGVLQYLQCNYLWGVKRCEFLCDVMSTACHGIDCGSRMAIAELAVQIFLDECLDSKDEKLQQKYEDIRVCSVQVLMNVDASEVSSARTSLQRLYKKEAATYGVWIEDDVFYHQCLGIYSTRTGILNIWDYNAWRRYSVDSHNFYNTVLAMFVSRYDRNYGDCRSVHGTYMNRISVVDNVQHLSWEGLVDVHFDRWSDVCEPGCPVYPRITNTNNSNETPDICSTSTVTTTTDSESRSIVEDVSKSISAIYISGCHMSSNPMPGVGIARCFKHGWGDQCPVLVGVDHLYLDVFSGITDPVFDKCRNIATYGFMRSRSRPCKDPDYIPIGGMSANVAGVGGSVDPWLMDHTQFPKETNVHDHDLWESVVSIVNNDDMIGHKAGAGTGGEVYFLPVSLIIYIYVYR